MIRTPGMGELFELFRPEQKDPLEAPKKGLLDAPEFNTTKHPGKTQKTARGRIKVKVYTKPKVVSVREVEKKRKESEMRRKDRILPGYKDLTGLSRGLMEEEIEEVELGEFIDAIKRFLETSTPEDKDTFYNEMERLGLVASERAIEYCKSKGLRDLEGWLRLQNSWERSKKGSLFQKEKK
jgi:hypothetical protein